MSASYGDMPRVKTISMKKFLMISLVVCGCSEVVKSPIDSAHAHNDYEHERPLFQALENGFVSVEADIHLIKGELYVSHDTPSDLKSTPTLESLYLAPLLNRIASQNGQVYEDYDGFFYLVIDLKTESDSTYFILRDLLINYRSILSVVTDSVDQSDKPVKAILTTYHTKFYDLLLNDTIKYAGLDGRPKDLAHNYPNAWMPMISQSCQKYLSWNGISAIDSNELFKLSEMIKEAHNQKKIVRLWGSPDFEDAWFTLGSIGVDLINTDKLKEYRNFYDKQ